MRKPTKSVKFTINSTYAPIEDPPHEAWEGRSKNTAISMLRFYGWDQ